MKNFKYVFNLVKFALNANPLLYLSIIISLFSVCIELLAMSSLLPLFELVGGNIPSKSGIVAKYLVLIGIEVNSITLIWVFIILFSIRILTQIVGQTLSIYLGKCVMAQLCSEAFEQIIHNFSIHKINEKSMGYYISLAGDESFRASTLVLSLTQFLSVGALALFYYFAIVLFSPTTAWLILIFSLCYLIAFIKIAKISHRLGGRQVDESRRTGTVFLDSLNNIKAVRAFSAEKYVVSIHRSIVFKYAKTLFWVDDLALLSKLVPILLLLGGFSLWFAFSSQMIESIGLSFVVTLIVYLMRFFPSVGQGVMLLMRIVSDAKSGKDITEILHPQVQPKNSQSRKSIKTLEVIELKDVCFNYNEVRKQVLTNINLKFQKGKSYAIVGKSGIGKSTLVDILMKFYSPTSGDVKFNNLPITELSDIEIRKKIILVSQDSAIFDDTVLNNIRLGIVATTTEVKSVCETIGIHNVILEMADGYDTRLQYQGKNLSGGQRQRIGIARALLRNPDVLILDESTSALDKHSQNIIVENILHEYSRKILIFVTHDHDIMNKVSEIVDLEKLNLVTKL